MRSFLFGLLVAAVCWWLWGRSAGAGEVALPTAATPEATAPPTSVRDILGDGAIPTTAVPIGGAPAVEPPTGSASATGAASGGAGPLAADAPAPTPAPAIAPAPLTHADLDALVAQVAQREPTAYARGWAALLPLHGADRERLAKALTPAGDDFASLVATLGDHNAFLHSAEGRGLAQKATAAAMALPDGDAVAAGTQLLNRMLRGRLAREDKDARLFVDEVYRQHRVRVDRWLCDPANVAGSRSHVVQKGESLARIATRLRKEGIAIEDGTLAVLNRIHNPNALQAGQKLKIPQAPIVGVLEKRSFGFAIYVGEHLLRLYWVGHGANDRTPLTEFKIGEKQPQPAWTSPEGGVYPYGHPKNILGEYFIKFLHDSYTGFGAHGTTLPDTICTMSSMGCIRMYDADIAELFKVLPRGAKVIVRATESLR
jgi:nucleoid-associated protein YgaU